MTAPDAIRQLVDKFRYNLHEYKNPRYSETQVRVEFINPFWEALGWDVLNKAGNAMAYRDVIHEAQIKVGGSTKAPDYAFKVGKERIFFLEAKKPARDLKNDPEPAFQLRRYAYSARLPVSILTDFEELSVYDTRLKPAINDKSHVGRILYYHFSDYLEKWGEIADAFSREAVMRGAFDRFIDDQSKGRGTTTLDRDFLNSLDDWRVHLAHNIALRNAGLSERELNYAVQMTIDRLIFLRMAEDRGIEIYGTLQALQNGENCYRRLVQIYYRADERYNSGLFHFEERDGAHPDIITPDLQVDDKVLKEIIRNLYYPCPYEFSQLPVEVLGNAYEQFLGKRITLTSGHRAKIEEKPEVRKAGGVYYTPQYIVDYIVEHTVGELVKDKTPRQVSELRVLDPACGSGSFLLGAYQYLLDWHLKAYIAEHQETGILPSSPSAKGQRPRKSDPQAIFQDRTGQWALSTAEKKRILLNNIYGVDIDANAVEVTKLSLLLKVLEDENAETLHQQLGLWHERALPNLAGNIKCGNSLIGSDYYDGRQSALFDEEEMRRVNAFDWQKEFADVFEKGGFDAVIGNPPYIRIQTLNETSKKSVGYFNKKYADYISGNYDIYILFIVKGFSLLNFEGLLGYILPHKFFQGEMGNNIRKYIANQMCVKRIINFSTNQIFESATTYTCLLFLGKTQSNIFKYKKFELGENFQDLCDIVFEDIDASFLTKTMWNFHSNSVQKVLNKIDNKPKNFKDITEKIFKGSSTGNDKIFLLRSVLKRTNTSLVYSIAFELEIEIESDLLRRFANGQDVRRYYIAKSDNYLLFPYNVANEKATLIDFDIMKKQYPLAFQYLAEAKNILMNRKISVSDHDFYKYSAGRSLTEYQHKKILVPDMLVSNRIAYDDEGTIFHGPAIHSVVFKEYDNIEDDLYYLGILNSKLFWFFIRNTSTALRGDAFRLTPEFLNPFNFPKPKENIALGFIDLVQNMINLNKILASTRDPRTREQLERQIEATDVQIDRLVYELYELTDEEIKIVEEATANK